LFHPDVPHGFIMKVFDVMERAPQHVFQILTKRPQRMAAFMEGTTDDTFLNVWLGTSIESDAYTFRANHLRDTPAAVRFLSLEPLLGPLPSLDLTGIDWVIVGCESGPGARPMDLAWVYELRDKARAAGCAFFVKQLSFGEPGVYHDIIDFPLGLRVREYPA
jgi:protein gp37